MIDKKKVPGLRSIRFHDLRHPFRSLLIRAGEPLAYVRDQMGHSSIKVTVGTYGHLLAAADIGWMNKLDEKTTPRQSATQTQPKFTSHNIHGSAPFASQPWPCSLGQDYNPSLRSQEPTPLSDQVRFLTLRLYRMKGAQAAALDSERCATDPTDASLTQPFPRYSTGLNSNIGSVKVRKESASF